MRGFERRERILLILQVITAAAVVGSMIFSIIQLQGIAEQRATAALLAARQNREVLTGIDAIVRDVRRAQVDQRQAFRALARRNQQLHGRDPSEAPQFRSITEEPASSNPAPDPGSDINPDRSEPSQPDDRQPDRDNGDRPRPVPRPSPHPTPSPSPDPICVPVVDVCLRGVGAHQ